MLLGDNVEDVDPSGSNCSFHGEIGYSSSALTLWKETQAPSNQEEAKNLSLDALYARKPPGPMKTPPQAQGTTQKRDMVLNNKADSPLYHENEPYMQKVGDPFGSTTGGT